jgi:hypothetical protein
MVIPYLAAESEGIISVIFSWPNSRVGSKIKYTTITTCFCIQCTSDKSKNFYSTK